MHLGKSQWTGCLKSLPSLILLFVLAEETVFICSIYFGLVWLHCRRSNTGAYTRQARTLPLGAVPSPCRPLRSSPFRQVMWRGDRTADWPIRGSLWWGERAPGDRARIVLSDSVVGGPGESPSPLGLDCYNTQHISVMVRMWRVPPQAHVFACLASSWGCCLGRLWDLSLRGTASLEEMAHLEWAMIAQPYFPPMFCFLIENAVWPDSSYSCYHGFPTMTDSVWEQYAKIKPSPLKLLLVRYLVRKKLEKYLMLQND